MGKLVEVLNKCPHCGQLNQIYLETTETLTRRFKLDDSGEQADFCGIASETGPQYYHCLSCWKYCSLRNVDTDHGPSLVFSF